MFYFTLRDGGQVLRDDEGVELPNVAAANVHAIRVAREVMKCDEVNKRSWLLEVLDECGTTVARVPFASVDPTLNHLAPDLRNLVERLAETGARLVKRDSAWTFWH